MKPGSALIVGLALVLLVNGSYARLVLANDGGTEIVVPDVGRFEVRSLEDFSREIRFLRDNGSTERIDKAKEHIAMRLVCYETENGDLVFEREYGRRALYVWRSEGEVVEVIKLAHDCDRPTIKDDVLYFNAVGDGYGRDENAFASWDSEGEHGRLAPCVHLGDGGYYWPVPSYYDPLKRKGGSVYTVTASSTLIENENEPGRFAPENAVDGRIGTAWSEGVEGNGVGESITITFAQPRSVATVVVLGGHAYDPRHYRVNNRIKRATIELSTGSEYDIVFGDDLKDILRAVTVGEDGVEWLRLTVDEVFPGEKYDDICIAEICVDAPYGVGPADE